MRAASCVAVRTEETGVTEGTARLSRLRGDRRGVGSRNRILPGGVDGRDQHPGGGSEGASEFPEERGGPGIAGAAGTGR